MEPVVHYILCPEITIATVKQHFKYTFSLEYIGK